MDEYNAAPNQDPIEEIQNTKEQEDSLRRLNEAFAGIAPFGVNEDLRTAPTGDAKPHTPQKGILEKIGDGISGAAESVSNAAKAGRIIDSKT